MYPPLLQSSQAEKFRLSKLVNLEFSSSKSGYQWVLLAFLIFATTITEIVTDMCPDGSFDDDWPLYPKDEANCIDLQLSLIVDSADIKEIVEYNTERNLDVRSIRSVCLSTYHPL